MLIVSIITGLNDGGAEAVLSRLVTIDKSNEHKVISLTGPGKYAEDLQQHRIEVITLGMRRGWPSLAAFFRLVKILRVEKPDLVQTWMYHADLFGGLAARFACRCPVVWGIRHGNLEAGKLRVRTISIVRVLALLSWWLPSRIIVCARSAIDEHTKMGYDRKKMYVIHNGYDLDFFRPKVSIINDPLKPKVLGRSVPVIGTVARFDAQKDHLNLLTALGILRRRGLPFECFLVGAGLTWSNEKIVGWIRQFGLLGFIRLLGPTNDTRAVMGALDLHVLPSSGEGFPNVLAEAMACGTPCVATDVGEAAYIIGDTGWVVPPRDAEALAEAITLAMRDLNCFQIIRERGLLARARIEKYFPIERMVQNYVSCWNEVLDLNKRVNR